MRKAICASDGMLMPWGASTRLDVATLTFDKLAYVDRLQAAGVGEREARALADGLDQALREEVVTRTDLRAAKTELAADITAARTELGAEIAAVKIELKADIAGLKTGLKGDIAELRTELKGDIAAVRTELKDDIAAVRTELKSDVVAVKHELQIEIHTTKHDILRWMVGMAFGQVALTVAFITFLPH